MATKTPKEIAVEWDTDPKTLRKFLRADNKVNGIESPGKGKRYALEAKSLRSLRKRFDAWIAQKAEKETTEPVAAETVEVLVEDNEVIDEEIALDDE